ncbi:MAG: patatin family protein [Oscillospiraceae bacterium]|nr:patatin family protein [Oscillospiraceae bacterium]
MNEKTGLILEGGAMRGLFTGAVLDVLMDEKIRLDGMIGVSAGATFGCNYVTHQPRRVLRYCLKYRWDPRFCSVLSLLLTGDMFGAKFCYHTLPDKLDPVDHKNFESCGIPYSVVCTDVETGEAVYHRCKTLSGRELEWVRASASMPLASRIVRVGGRAMLDGGISDSVPLRYFREQGYRKNVIVLTQPAGYQKTPNRMMPLMRTVYRAYPALIRAMEERHLVYNEQIREVSEAEKRGEVFVIRPPHSLPIRHTAHSAEKLRETYAIGRKTALQALPALKAFLES